MSHKKAKEIRRLERMKAWRINLKEYDFTGRVRDESGNIVTLTLPYDVKESLALILFNSELKLSIDESFRSKDLADKIRASENGNIIVDSAEMAKIKSAYNIVKGPGEHELEFFRRIKDAEEVEMEEAKDKKAK